MTNKEIAELCKKAEQAYNLLKEIENEVHSNFWKLKSDEERNEDEQCNYHALAHAMFYIPQKVMQISLMLLDKRERERDWRNYQKAEESK